MKHWYQMKVEDAVAEILIFDFIGDWIDDLLGFGVTAKQFAAELGKLPENVKTIRVRINSPGGDVFGAVTIANALRAQKEKGRRVEVVVDGLAASAASIVAMAGDVVKMADNALLMLHNPWNVTVGTAADMRKQADVLDEVRDRIVVTYQWRADLSDEEIKGLMDAETWMPADQAIELGFADEKIEGLRASASIDPRAVALLGLKIPAQYAERVQTWQRRDDAPAPAPAPPVPAPMAADAVVRLCADSGLDIAFANDLIAGRSTEDAARAAASQEKQRRDAEASRVKSITALCERFQHGDLAAEMIAGGMSAEQSVLLMAKITAKVDRVELDAGLNPDLDGHARSRGPNPTKIYRERNRARG